MGPSSWNSLLDFFCFRIKVPKIPNKCRKLPFLKDYIIFLKFSWKNDVFDIFVHFGIYDHKIKVIKNCILPSRTNFLLQNFIIKVFFFVLQSFGKLHFTSPITFKLSRKSISVGEKQLGKGFQFFHYWPSYGKLCKEH